MITTVLLLFVLILCLAYWCYIDRNINGGTADEIPEYLKYHFKMTGMPFIIPKKITNNFPIILPCYCNTGYQLSNSNVSPFILHEIGYFDGETLHIPKFKYSCDSIVFNREINEVVPRPLPPFSRGRYGKCIEDYKTNQNVLLKVLGNYNLYNKVILDLYNTKESISNPCKATNTYINLLNKEDLLNYPNIFTNNYHYLSRHILDCDYKKNLNLVFNDANILSDISDKLKDIKKHRETIDQYMNTVETDFTSHISLQCILHEVKLKVTDAVKTPRNESIIDRQITMVEDKLNTINKEIENIRSELKSRKKNDAKKEKLRQALISHVYAVKDVESKLIDLNLIKSEDNIHFYINLGYLLSDGPYEVLINQCGITSFDQIDGSRSATVIYIKKMFNINQDLFNIMIQKKLHLPH